MKACCACKVVLPLEAFHVDKDKKSGRAARCKQCCSAYMRRYYEANKEKIGLRSAEWHEKNFERKAKRVSEYHRKNAARVRLYKRKWQAANPDYRNESLVKRRRAKAGATPVWANREVMRSIYRQARQLSLETGIKHHVDHIVPLQSTLVCGLHVEHNLQVLPWLDNVKKHNRLWPDMPEAS